MFKLLVIACLAVHPVPPARGRPGNANILIDLIPGDVTETYEENKE